MTTLREFGHRIFTKTTTDDEVVAKHYRYHRWVALQFLKLNRLGLKRSFIYVLNKARYTVIKMVDEPDTSHEFKKAYAGLDFGGLLPAHELGLANEELLSATGYEATSELEFHYVMRKLKIQFEQYDFVDYGSGKGAMLIEASDYDFNTIVGLEFSKNLVDISIANVEKYQHDYDVSMNNVVHRLGNCMNYSLLKKPHVIFMYNPFGPDVMKPVVDQLEKSLARIHKPSYIIYHNPMHHEVFEDRKNLKLKASYLGGTWLVFESRYEYEIA